jgi:hypothetical protein
MYPKMKNLIIYSIVIAVTSGLLKAAQEYKDTTKLLASQKYKDTFLLETMPKATKGFPLVVKVIIKGPQKVKYLSIYDEHIPITVYLKSESDGKEFVIKSRRISSYEATTSDGRHIEVPEDEVDPPVEIQEGQKYTMMFDLWSLLPYSDLHTALSDVPAGKYNLFIELDSAYPLPIDIEAMKEVQNQNIRGFGGGISTKQYIKKITKSNSIDIELIEPIDKEKQFIEKTRKLGNTIGSVVNKVGVNWARWLCTVTIFPENDISAMTQISKDQISFHKLLSEVNIDSEKARSKSIKDVNDAKLPKFFEPERQLLLFQLKGNPADERENLIQKYPQLQGNVERLKPGDKVLFRYSRQLPD